MLHCNIAIPYTQLDALQDGEPAPPKDTTDPEAVSKRRWDYSKARLEYVSVAPAHQEHVLTKARLLERPPPPPGVHVS